MQVELIVSRYEQWLLKPQYVRSISVSYCK